MQLNNTNASPFARAGFQFWPPAWPPRDAGVSLSTWPPVRPTQRRSAAAGEPDTFVPPATPATPAQQTAAATTIQRMWRGHLGRGIARRAHLQHELVKVTHRQTELCALGARLPHGVALHPALLEAPAQVSRKRRRSQAAGVTPVNPCEMNVDQRLQRLKLLYASRWETTLADVGAEHPEFIHRAGNRALSSDARRRLLGQLRDDLFVQNLPPDACAEAGFFSPGCQQVVVRRRNFVAPRGDLPMQG